MKPLPDDPFAFQARVMDALLGDIRDPEAKGFPRLDAMRAVHSPNPYQGTSEEKDR